MNRMYCMLLFIEYLAVLINCQGGGEGGYVGGGYYRRNSNCTTDGCQQNSAIRIVYTFAGFFALFVLFVGITCCCQYYNGRPRQENSSFVSSVELTQFKSNADYTNIFQSGICSSRYYQYGTWHGPYRCSLTFDPQTMKVTGTGTDDVGTFTIDGTYSHQTNRVGLRKTYQRGTGNPRENLGHQVTIQLTWNGQNNQFDGKWYVQTNKYHGENKFELKFNGQQLSANKNV